MKLLNFIIYIASFVIIICFFIPWLSVQPKGGKHLTSMWKNSNLEKMKNIRGYEIPSLANREDSKIVMKILRLFIGKLENLDKKSRYIYTIPGIAIITILLGTFKKNYKLIALIYFIIGCGIYFMALYKINTTNLDLTLLKLNIEEGIKYTQYSFLTIGIVGFIRLIFLS